MTHPLFLDYGITSQKDFPLILIVGREPNLHSVCDKSLGQFDFDRHPNCAFWNIAFKTLGAYQDLNTVQVKDLFWRKQASPLVFTDASPSAIENKTRDKDSIRVSLTDAEIAEHVDAMFGNEQILNRVKLVLLSGLHGDKFNRFRGLFEQRIKTRGIPFEEIPFLYGTNYEKIKRKLGDAKIEIIKNVFETYNTSCPIIMSGARPRKKRQESTSRVI